MKNGFIFYKSFYDAIHRLNNKELKADIFEAICELALNENNIELTDEVGQMIMDLIKPQILANNKKYEDGKKGGRPKKITSGYENIETSGYQEIETSGYENKKPKEKEKEKEKKKEKEKEKVKVKEKIYKKESFYENEKLNNLFLEFLQIRKKLKAVNSDRAIKMLLNKLSKFNDQMKYAMIEQSIVHSWKDIYELKQEQVIKPKWFDNQPQKEEIKYTDEEQKIYDYIK